MTQSSTGLQSPKHRANNALWYDIPPFASRGISPAIKMFDGVFSLFKSCKISILEIDTFITNEMKIVCTIQKIDIFFTSGVIKNLTVRETDCFQKTNSEWKLIHQHVSVPNAENCNGKIVTE